MTNLQLAGVNVRLARRAALEGLSTEASHWALAVQSLLEAFATMERAEGAAHAQSEIDEGCWTRDLATRYLAHVGPPRSLYAEGYDQALRAFADSSE